MRWERELRAAACGDNAGRRVRTLQEGRSGVRNYRVRTPERFVSCRPASGRPYAPVRPAGPPAGRREGPAVGHSAVPAADRCVVRASAPPAPAHAAAPALPAAWSAVAPRLHLAALQSAPSSSRCCRSWRRRSSIRCSIHWSRSSCCCRSSCLRMTSRCVDVPIRWGGWCRWYSPDPL
jgi:hypothetical protein